MDYKLQSDISEQYNNTNTTNTDNGNEDNSTGTDTTNHSASTTITTLTSNENKPNPNVYPNNKYEIVSVGMLRQQPNFHILSENVYRVREHLANTYEHFDAFEEYISKVVDMENELRDILADNEILQEPNGDTTLPFTHTGIVHNTDQRQVLLSTLDNMEHRLATTAERLEEGPKENYYGKAVSKK
jgi:hypothetical protein